MNSISDCIPHEFKFPCLWTQDSGCIPMSPYSLPMNLRLHSHEFKSLFPSQWISDCIPMSSYSQANESQTAFPWVPIPQPMNLRLHSHEFLFPAKFWSLLVGYHPCPAILIQNVPIEAKKIAFWRDLRGTPIHTTWVPLKSIVERFRCLLRDFCFWANFSIFRFEKILIFDALKRIKRKRGDWSTTQSPQNGHPEWFWNDKITA